MEDRAVLQFLLLSLLCLFQTGTSTPQCLDNAPQYGSRGSGGDDVSHLASNTIYIIPDYTFSCYGNVTQWGACVEREGDEYDIQFIVARPSDSFPNCYRGIATNRIAGTATDGYITLNVSVSDLISVEPGDVVGLVHSVSTMSGPMVDNGIELDITASSVTVWHSTLDSIELNNPNCEYSLGPGGNLPNAIAAAPVITAVVEPLQVPSTPSPSHSTSPAPSTPSPSTIPSPSSPTQDGGSTLSTSTVAGIAAGAVGGVLLIIIIILLIIISILKSKVKDTSTGKLRAEMKRNESYAITTTTHQYQSSTDTLTVEQNGAYQSATDTVTTEQNGAYSGTVVGATQDVIYEEIDGLYEEPC